jgi:Na+-driven multidrug efflux pump
MNAPVMAYAVCLTVHNYLRWLVLGLGVLLWVRALHGVVSRRSWQRADEHASVMLVAATDVQLLLGLLLHQWLSPIAQVAVSTAIAVTWAQPTLRFFGYLHPLMMLTAFVVVHVVRGLSKRRTESIAKFQITVIGLSVCLVLVALAIPWPWFEYGRPLFRTGG